ncbi:MAG: hypothetical protein LBD22_01990 [Spirochaetaceae bacterium]|jgi:hypothetical protein|nr:hypothetical protein [Spirochaetaceae bacterium]
MKKLMLVSVIGLVLSIGTVHAKHPLGFGIGLQAGWAGWGEGGLTLKIPVIPIFWTINGGSNALSVAGDFYLLDLDIIKNLGWYVGAGAYAGFASFWGDGNTAVWLGGRIPVGLYWRPVPLLELYGQVVPSIAITFLPGFGLHTQYWGANIGIRLWI